MGDLGWERIFSPNFLVIEFFSLTYKATVLQVLCKYIFFPRNQFEGYFLLKSTIPPLKSRMLGPFSNQESVVTQLGAISFVARMVGTQVLGGETRITFQFVLQQCCKTGCTYLLSIFTEALCLYFRETAVKFCGLWICRLGIKGD